MLNLLNLLDLVELLILVSLLSRSVYNLVIAKSHILWRVTAATTPTRFGVSRRTVLSNVEFDRILGKRADIIVLLG
jgi:hypothetical protein